MAKCSQCLHWDACSMLFEMAIGRKPTANGNKAEEKCPHFKDKTINTNADRIRAMSDGELARFLAERSVNESTVQLLDKDNDLTAVQIEALRHKIYCALMQWLKQPAEVE